MRLEDIAKLTIDEVNAQLQGTNSAVPKNGFIVEEASDNDESNELRREFDFNQEPRQTMQTQFKAQTIAQKEAAKKNAKKDAKAAMTGVMSSFGLEAYGISSYDVYEVILEALMSAKETEFESDDAELTASIEAML